MVPLAERIAARYMSTVEPVGSTVLGAVGRILLNETDSQKILASFKEATEDNTTERILESAEFMNGNGVQQISLIEKSRPPYRPGDEPSRSYVLRTYADHFGLNVMSETSLAGWPAASWLANALQRTSLVIKGVSPKILSDYLPDISIQEGEQRPRKWEQNQSTYGGTITARVLSRFHQAMEHTSPEARREYLHEHPHADPANHQVSKPKEHGHGDHGEKPKKTWKERLQGLGEKAKNFVTNAPTNVKKFFEDDAHRRSVLMGAHKKLVDAPESLVKNAIHTVKHEIKEFKEAGEGVAAVLKGGKMNDHQKKALKTVGFHLALTAVATVLTASGGPLAGAAIFGKSMAKHVAMKAVSNALGHLHVLEEMGHIGHGLGHILDKLAAEGKKADPEDVMAKFFLAALAKELEKFDLDDIEAALNGMDQAEA